MTRYIGFSEQHLPAVAHCQGKAFDCQKDDPFLLTLDYQPKSYYVDQANQFVFHFLLSDDAMPGDVVIISANALEHRKAQFHGEVRLTLGDVNLKYVDITLSGQGISGEYVIQQLWQRNNKILLLKNQTAQLHVTKRASFECKESSRSSRLLKRISHFLR